jgi:hypothetical protein
MARTCTICSHSQRLAIDEALVAGGSFAAIATKYHVIDESLRRHKASHLPESLIKAHEAEDLTQALDVVKQLKAINAASLNILSDARKARDGDLALKAIDRIHKQIELQARLLGELDDRTQINVLLAPEWLHIRAVVLTALGGHPEAKRAVAANLAALEVS